jgi:23S rRNA (uracil1939-C5)-methyltransferase
MVPGVIPAERVAVKFRQEKKGYVQAELLEVLQASPQRIPPPCPYYGECGGCDLQHISYEGQLRVKEEIIKAQLTHAWDADKSWQDRLSEIQPAEEPFGYRQRLRFQVDARGRLGFYRARSRDIVPISSCLLALPLLDQVFAELQESEAAGNLLKNSEALELMYDQREDKVIALFHFDRKPRAMDIQHAKECAERIGALKVLFLKTKAWGDFGPFYGEQAQNKEEQEAEHLHYAVRLADGKRVDMLFEAGGFCQVNAGQNENLVRTMLDWAKISRETTILDLYCGLGNFSIPAAFYAKSVVGMDIQRSAIRSARKNAANNRLENCSFEQQSAMEAARNLARDGKTFDLVILDPPRQGCKEIIPLVEKITAACLIYISCDPATLARDLQLLKNSGFQIENMQGIDMFPQTHHVETIVKLRKMGAFIPVILAVDG